MVTDKESELPGSPNAGDEVGSADRIPTAFRNLLILEVLAEAAQPLTPTQINERLQLPKQTVHRLCAGLLEEGFLIRTADGKRLRPSRRTRTIASGLLHSSRAHIGRHQILNSVAQKIGETVNFVVPEDQGMSYLDRVETNWAFRVLLPVGSHVPFHCTASGKTFLANLPKSIRKTMVHSLALTKLSPNTIVDPETLLAELDKIARQGFAEDNEEFIEGMVAVAVPVLDSKGRFFAALAVHGPTVRFSMVEATSKTSILFEAAKQLQGVLFD